MNQSPRTDVVLRAVDDTDLPTFFEYLRDPQAQALAASTFEDYTDPQGFSSYWSKLRRNEDAVVRTITLADAPDEIAGHISVAPNENLNEVRYWVDRTKWGQGIATAALAAMLHEVRVRPIEAHVVRRNAAGVAVLRRNGFTLAGQDTGFDAGKGRIIDDVILRLA